MATDPFTTQLTPIELELREAGNELWELEGIRDNAHLQNQTETVTRCEKRMLAIAQRAYQNAHTPSPHQVVACYVAALALRMLHRPDEAIGGFQRLVTLDPAIPEAWLELTALHAELDQPLEALKAAKQAARLLPAEPDAWINLGRCLLAVNEPHTAREAFQTAADLDPSPARIEEINTWLPSR